jgi:hypothetical protein
MSFLEGSIVRAEDASHIGNGPTVSLGEQSGLGWLCRFDRNFCQESKSLCPYNNSVAGHEAAGIMLGNCEETDGFYSQRNLDQRKTG